MLSISHADTESIGMIQHLQILRSREILSQSPNDYRFFFPHRNDASFKVLSLRHIVDAGHAELDSASNDITLT